MHNATAVALKLQSVAAVKGVPPTVVIALLEALKAGFDAEFPMLAPVADAIIAQIEKSLQPAAAAEHAEAPADDKPAE